MTARALLLLILPAIISGCLAEGQPELARPQTPLGIREAETPSFSGFLASSSPAGTWNVPGGASLKGILQEWSERAGWRLAIDRSFDGDYLVAGGYRFEGTFETAAYQLMAEVVRNADPPPKLVLYPANLHAVLFRQTKEAN